MPRPARYFLGTAAVRNRHVSYPASSSLPGESGTYDPTNWTGGSAGPGPAVRGYAGRSLAGVAAWQPGHVVGRTMRFIGMGNE